MKKTAFLFSGQGAQSAGMGLDMYQNNIVAQTAFDIGESLRRGTIQQCFYGTAEELTKTENAQPCLFLTDLAMAEALAMEGITAHCAAGFSLGEIPALAFTNVLSVKDAFNLVVLRGKKMAECAERHPGGMVAVLKLDKERVEEICSGFSEVWAVNYNCPGQIACSGSEEQLDDFCGKVKEAGGRAARLAVSGAFHTPYMGETGVALYNALGGMQIEEPNIPLYANLTGEPYPHNSGLIKRTIARQVCSPVYWEKTILAMSADGVERFIEVGAGKTLTGLVKRILPQAETYTVNDYASFENTVAAVKGN
ncbi:MAG: ACP S-malonyltransferase [Clostridia bacterium]|nr:ACP S-malonyltransferase [Clostridia bacterium]